MKFAQAFAGLGPWKLSKNEIWSIPENPKVHFKIEQESDFASLSNSLIGKIISITALVINHHGKVYGIQKAIEIKEDKDGLFNGQIFINDDKVKCYTGSKLFEREDGSLCDVAVLWI